jgi:hypothetical protein
MDYAKTEFLLAADKYARGVLRQLTEDVNRPQPGSPEAAHLQSAQNDCEVARLALVADLYNQLRAG